MKKLKPFALDVGVNEFNGIKRQAQEIWKTWEEEEALAKEIRDLFAPYRGHFAGEKANKDGKAQGKKNLRAVGTLAARRLAAGIYSGVTSPARPWLRLQAGNEEIRDIESVKIYGDEVSKSMIHVFNKSNFYNSLRSCYDELSSFATTVMMIEEDSEDVIRCTAFTIGEYAIGVNEKNQVKRLFRNFELTVEQLVSQFGLDNLPKEIQDSSKNDNQKTEKKKVYHLIEPNPKHNPLTPGASKMPTAYRSIYWLEGHKEVLQVRGYRTQPFVACRWDVISNNPWGRGPGHEVMVDIKGINAIEEKGLKALAKMVDPPVIAPDNSKQINMIPGGVTKYSGANGGGDQMIKPLYDVRFDIASADAKVEQYKQEVKEAFYTDLFQMISSSTGPQMTAREVIERHEEKMTMLGPVLDRLHKEFLEPTVERVYDIMSAAEILPEPPEELAGEELKVEFVSILAQAQKMVGMTGIRDFMTFVGEVGQMNPEVMEKVDYDEVVEVAAENLGVPPGIIFGEDEMRARQEERQAAQAEQEKMAQAAQEMELLKSASESAKNVAQIPTDGENALSGLMKGAGTAGMGAM